MALGVLFFLGYVFLLRPPPEVPVPDLSAVQGVYRWESVIETGGAKTTTIASGAFSAVAAGDAGGDAAAGGQTADGGSRTTTESAYDAEARRQSDRVETSSGWRYATTIAAWPPVWRLATHGPLDYQGLAAVVRSAVEDGDRTVGIKPVSDQGRKAWRAAMTFAGQDLVDLVVDQETGIVTWCSETTPGSSEVFTFTPAWASPPPAGEKYRLGDGAAGAPDSATVVKDTAWTYVPAVADVRAAAGWGPLGSDLAPDGFAQRALATTPADLRLAGQLVNDFNGAPPVSPDEPLVAQLYTRGLTSFTVEQYGPKTTRFYEDALDSILKGAAAEELSFQSETLQYGWFKGLLARSWYEKSGPTLFVAGRHRMVYITGALTRQELISFVEGLKPLP
jgi:hypothetical protein